MLLVERYPLLLSVNRRRSGYSGILPECNVCSGSQARRMLMVHGKGQNIPKEMSQLRRKRFRSCDCCRHRDKRYSMAAFGFCANLNRHGSRSWVRPDSLPARWGCHLPRRSGWHVVPADQHSLGHSCAVSVQQTQWQSADWSILSHACRRSEGVRDANAGLVR